MTGVIAFAAVAFAFAVFAFGWWHDSRRTVIVTPFALFGINLLVRDLPPAIVGAGGTNPDYYPIAVVLVALLSFVLGFHLYGTIMGYQPALPARYRDTSTTIDDQRLYFLTIGVGVLLLAYTGFMFFDGLPPVSQALVQLVQGNPSAAVAKFVGASRKLITKGQYLGGEYRAAGVLLTVLRTGWPFLLAMAAVLWFRTRRPSWAVTSAILLMLSFVFVAGDGTRGPFLWSLLYVVVVLSWEVRMRSRALIATVMGVVGVAMLISLLSPKLNRALSRDDGLQFAVAKITQRILLDNGANTVAIINLVRSGAWEFRLGDVHVRRFTAALPGKSEQLSLARELFMARDPGSSASTYASGTYLGDVFLDFGLVGVGAVFFVLGMIVGAVQIALVRAPKTVLTLPLLGFLVLHLGRVSLVGPMGFITNMVVACCMFLLMYATFVAARVLGTFAARDPMPLSGPVDAVR